MNITKSTITKTTFTITLDSIVRHYMANKLEWLENYSKEDLESSIGELALFSARAEALSKRNPYTIKELFESDCTYLLLSEEDFYTIKQAEIDKEGWEILVTNFDKEIVRIPGEDVGW